MLRTPNKEWFHPFLNSPATHCIVIARLFVNKEDKGVHAFFIELRSVLQEHYRESVTLEPKRGAG